MSLLSECTTIIRFKHILCYKHPIIIKLCNILLDNQDIHADPVKVPGEQTDYV